MLVTLKIQTVDLVPLHMRQPKDSNIQEQKSTLCTKLLPDSTISPTQPISTCTSQFPTTCIATLKRATGTRLRTTFQQLVVQLHRVRSEVKYTTRTRVFEDTTNSPGISIFYPYFMTATSLNTKTAIAMGSDHLPIIIDFSVKQQSQTSATENF